MCRRTDRHTSFPVPSLCVCVGAIPDAAGSSVGRGHLLVLSWREGLRSQGNQNGRASVGSTVARADLAARGDRTGQSCSELEVGAVRSVRAQRQARDVGRPPLPALATSRALPESPVSSSAPQAVRGWEFDQKLEASRRAPRAQTLLCRQPRSPRARPLACFRSRVSSHLWH